MNIIEYKEMNYRENFYWWHTGRMNIVNKQLSKICKGKNNLKILNVGCGTGGTIPTIEMYGKVTNVDVSAEALKLLKIKGFSGELIKDHMLPFGDNSFDIVIALDVLEHIKKDSPSLDEWRRVLKKHGSVFVTVPAYNFLWSGHDESLHHQRRYTRKSLDRDLRKSQFVKNKNSYMISFSLPLVVGFRTLHKIMGKKMNENSSYVTVPHLVNTLFDRILRLEGTILKHLNLPFGTSVLAIYKK